MDPISISGKCILKLSVPERFSRIPVGGEAEYHNHGAVEAHGSSCIRVDLVDAIHKCDIQHLQGEDNVKSVEGAVEYVRETVDYEQCVFERRETVART